MVGFAETDKEKILRTMEHLKDSYFKTFMSSLDNLEIHATKCGMVLITDKLTKDVWGFKLSLIENMSNLEIRSFLVSFLLKETWDNDFKSEFYVCKLPPKKPKRKDVL